MATLWGVELTDENFDTFGRILDEAERVYKTIDVSTMPEFTPPPHTPPDVPESGIVKADPALITADNYTEPWNRQPDEEDRAWELFVYYRDLGVVRSLQDVADHFGLKLRSIHNFSGPNRWRDRVRSWDQYQERIYAQEVSIKVREMANRHAETASNALAQLVVPFEALAHAQATNPNFVADLSELEVKKLIDLAVKTARVIPMMQNAERMALGQPTEIVSVEGEVKHALEMDDDQLSRVLATLDSTGFFDDVRAEGRVDSSSDSEIIEIQPITPDS